ncbi:hypothetical protein [Leptospira santarosai]|uniref:hypothetical protein n=1 Tax=Leptospira santarosai TaxID=28183 RepID=UPI000BB9E6BE|nr:hypothetical protein [Leptospira santarosai]ASV11741.1 hypothetical protein B2G51_08340 [Leptospira santarosai]MDO6383841.1 hypothetical protein [Leptospira santarosai]
MTSFPKNYRSFLFTVSLTLLGTFPLFFCLEQTRSEKEMIDFSKYVPKKTIEIEIDKQAQSEFVLLPDKKNQNKEIKNQPALSSILSPTLEPNTLIIPAETKFILSLNSYCLKSSGAGPSSNEPYKVIHATESNEIRKLLNSMWGQCNSRQEVQSLAWNITNRVPHNALPPSQRQMLGLSKLLQTVENVPILGFGVKIVSAPISIAKDLVVYTVENFASVESEILNRKSEQQMTSKPEPSRHGPFFIEVLNTRGFSGVTISVYNYTTQSAKFQAHEFQLQPERKDVQPLAIELSRTLACHYRKSQPIEQIR